MRFASFMRTNERIRRALYEARTQGGTEWQRGVDDMMALWLAGRADLPGQAARLQGSQDYESGVEAALDTILHTR